MKYVCLKHQRFIHPKGYEILPVREEDIESIRIWRNAQMDILRQKKEIESQEQQHYFKTVIFPDFQVPHPSHLLMSFLLKGELIGYGGLVHIDWEAKRAEVSFLVNPERLDTRYDHDFKAYMELISSLTFEELKFHRLFTESYAFREHNMALHESMGFKKEGILRDHAFKKGKWQNSVLHGLLVTEWKPNVEIRKVV